MDGAAGSGQDDTPVGGPIFSDAIRWVIEVAEGGSKVITDQGGMTRWGISQRAYPELDISKLTRNQAEDIYFQDYWRPIRGNALPPALALVVFDAAVNMGPGRATKILQGCLRVEADGVMGPITVGAAKMFLPRAELVAMYLYGRLRYYEELARADPVKHLSSLHGWEMRLFRLALEAGRWRGL